MPKLINNKDNKAHRFFNMSMILVFTFILVFSSGLIATAADVSNNITTLTATPSELNDGEKTTIRFTFDEHDKKIQSGDTLVLNWGSSGEIYGIGYEKTIKLLTHEGVYVGDMIVGNGEARVTFNDAINGLHNITGWGEFEIQGRNLTPTNNPQSGTFSITGGTKTVKVLVKKEISSGGVDIFYYKTGAMEHSNIDYVKWFLIIGHNQANLVSDVRIVDEIQPGQRLVMESFTIDVSGVRNQSYFGEIGLSNFLNDFPGSILTANPATGQITIEIPRAHASLNTFFVGYQTKVENSSQSYFVNHSKAWYQEFGKAPVEGIEFNFSVENINISGGVNQGTTTTTTTTEPSTTSTTITTVEPTTVVTTTTVEPEPTTVATTTTAEPSTTSTISTTAEPTTVPDATTSQTPPPAGKKRKILPKTGEESGLTASLIGLVLMAVAGVAGVLYRKSKES